jgi:hypothetical protein
VLGLALLFNRQQYSHVLAHTARGASLSRVTASDEQTRGREDNPRDECCQTGEQQKVVDDVGHDAPHAAPQAIGLPQPQAHSHTVTKTWQRPPGSMTTAGASVSKRKYPSLTLADLFRAHAEECIRAALNTGISERCPDASSFGTGARTGRRASSAQAFG